MFDEAGAERREIDRRGLDGRGARLELLSQGFCRALGHSIIALVIAFGFVKIAYVEARAIIWASRGFFRAGAEAWRRSGAWTGAKFLLGKRISPL
ncbi:hypothetical protein C5689_03910 [Methylosinus sporium]|uniref:Uncharacterized protein n=1 Tax=Methylosinus sporium TaxID=428 RepID=A0A2U1SUL6_METSR|nr:hypothetical protein [Methylosinus sporium]PWB95292.1 hypothetical protein C5689_03910 [Methylosinus sporium]